VGNYDFREMSGTQLRFIGVLNNRCCHHAGKALATYFRLDDLANIDNHVTAFDLLLVTHRLSKILMGL